MSLSLSRNKFNGFLILIFYCGFFSQTEAQQVGRKSFKSEVRFDSGEAARDIPFEMRNNHIYLQVRINNSESLSFILDTGASTVISEKSAKNLGLKLQGKEKGFGVGENAVETSFAEGVSLKISGATLLNQKIAVVSLQELEKSLGRKVDGILGYSFLRQIVVEIDYAAKTVNLYSPDNYKYRGKGERVPLIVDPDSELIFARATLKFSNRLPVKGLFEIDSGGGHALLLNSPFVRRNNLLKEAQKATAVSVGGINGSSRAVPGTVENLQIGSASRLANINTFFSLAIEGMLASGEFDGNIGNDFLRHFKVVFDYPHRSMFLEPNSAN